MAWDQLVAWFTNYGAKCFADMEYDFLKYFHVLQTKVSCNQVGG